MSNDPFTNEGQRAFPDNPYAAPTGVSGGSFSTGSPKEVAKRKVIIPSIVLLTLAPFAALFLLGDAAFRILAFVSTDINNPWIDANNEAERVGALVGNGIGLVVDVIGVFAQCFVAYGALEMFRLKKRGPAWIACVISCIPCLTGCCILGIPFGIWGLVALKDPVVRNAFDS